MSAVPVDLGASGLTSTLPSVLHLAAPLPGLPGHVEFTLAALDEIGVLFSLRSEPAGQTPLRLFAVAPGAFFPDYAPTLREDVRVSVGAGQDALVTLVIVHPAEGNDPPTANLLAPLVVEPVTGTTVQTVLDDDWPLRAPLR